MSKRLAPYALPLALSTLVILYTAWFTFLSFRRYEALDTGGYDLGNMDQATWNTLRGCILCETNVEGIDNRLAHHVEPIFLLIAPLYLIHSGARTLLLLQTVVVALGALPVFWLTRDLLKNEWLAIIFAAAYLLFPALQAANLDEFHPVTLAPTLLLFAFYFVERGKPVWFFTFLLLALSCKEDIPLLAIMLGLFLLLVRRDKKIGLLTTAIGLCWFYVSVYLVIPRFNPEGGSPFLSYYDHLGENPVEMAWTLASHPRLAVELLASRESLEFVLGMLAPVAFTPLWPLVVGSWLLVTRHRHPQAPRQWLVLGIPPLLLMLVALPSLSISLLSSNEWMHQVNVSHHSVPGVPFFVLAGIYGLASVKSQLETAGTSPLKSARASSLVRWLLPAGALLAVLVYHRYHGFTPLAEGFRPVPLTAHHRRVKEIVSLIPSEARVSSSHQVNSQVSQRRWVYIWPNLHEADFVFLDVVPGASPLIVNDMYQTVQELLRRGEYGVRASRDGYLLLERGLDNPNLSDDFYSFARADAPQIQHPVNVKYGQALQFLGYDLVQERTASVYLTLYFSVETPVEHDYRFFLFFTDADGNTVAEEPPLTAPIRYPLSQELVASRWYPPSRWKVGEVVQADTWHWTLAKPAEVAIALGVVDGPGQWDLTQRVRPSIVGSGEETRLIQDGTLLQLLLLRSDGRQVTAN